MAHVLVVDDVKELSEELSFSLVEDGHIVHVAFSGEEAILRGAIERPQLVVTDWILRDHPHGLGIIEALRVVSPAIHAMVMTGFASDDLRGEAAALGVCDFLEKPFDVEQLRTGIRRVVKGCHHSAGSPPIAFLEVRADGGIVFKNPAAERLLQIKHQQTLGELFGEENAKIFHTVSSSWGELPPLLFDREEKQTPYFFRMREVLGGQRRFLIALPYNDASLKESSVVSSLLGPAQPHTPSRRHILVVDDLASSRLLAVSLLREHGYTCHSASSADEAIRIFAHDPDIDVVVLNAALHQCGGIALGRRFRALRPTVTLIGTGERKHRADFELLGEAVFLPTPWTTDELLSKIHPSRRVSTLPCLKAPKTKNQTGQLRESERDGPKNSWGEELPS